MTRQGETAAEAHERMMLHTEFWDMFCPLFRDDSMPRLNGIDALHLLKKHNPDVKVVFLTMHQDRAYARRALEAGAAGFVVKHAAPDELVMAIHAALKGKTFITPALAGDVLDDIQHNAIKKKNAKTR